MMQLLLACACMLRLGTASVLYERRPWTNEGEFVSFETHPDGTPFEPVPGDGGLCGALTTEVENFTVVTAPGQAAPFVVTEWGHDHYYGATFENTFAHSKALLHSTNQSIGSAHGSMPIPKSATYYVAVRYEAAYRFETEFTVTISGAGTFKKIYGQRASPKVSTDTHTHTQASGQGGGGGGGGGGADGSGGTGTGVGGGGGGGGGGVVWCGVCACICAMLTM